MRIYPPANDVCQDAAFLFKDRPELIWWVYGEAWETSSVKVYVTPNEALPHIDRQPQRNAKDDHCNRPALR